MALHIPALQLQGPAIWGAYEEFKREYMETQARCKDQGSGFLPFVLEAHGGGVGPTARRVCARLAKGAAAKDNTEVEEQATSLLRRISIAVHRENARAVLKRLPGLPEHAPGPNPEAWGEDASALWQ